MRLGNGFLCAGVISRILARNEVFSRRLPRQHGWSTQVGFNSVNILTAKSNLTWKRMLLEYNLACINPWLLYWWRLENYKRRNDHKRSWQARCSIKHKSPAVLYTWPSTQSHRWSLSRQAWLYYSLISVSWCHKYSRSIYEKCSSKNIHLNNANTWAKWQITINVSRFRWYTHFSDIVFKSKIQTCSQLLKTSTRK